MSLVTLTMDGLHPSIMKKERGKEPIIWLLSTLPPLLLG